MRLTEFSKRALAARRQYRDLSARGYEKLDESGGYIWQLVRGGRQGYRITDAIISTSRTFVWIKCEKDITHAPA